MKSPPLSTVAALSAAWVLVACLSASVSGAAETAVNPDVSFKKLERTIDLSSSLVKIRCVVEVSNGHGQKELKSFHWTNNHDHERGDKVAFIEATVSPEGMSVV